MENTVSAINALTANFKPLVGVVLGSGLGGFVSEIDIRYSISYSEIEGFPLSTVAGHDGKLIFGYIENCPVVVMKGRFHYYEGYSPATVTLPIRVMKMLGVEYVLLSNAAGAINSTFRIGDVMLINNHINFIPNPLIGANDERFGVRFPDMKKPYSDALINMAHSIRNDLREGVYAALTGPSYETAAEINMLRVLGADAVGMSTAPEVIVARHCSMEVFAVSVITNDTSENEVTHQEVIEIGRLAGEKMNNLFREIIKNIWNIDKV